MNPPYLVRLAPLWIIYLRVAGLVVPPVVAVGCFVRQWRKRDVNRASNGISPALLGGAVLVNWVVFLQCAGIEKFDRYLAAATSLFLPLTLLSAGLSFAAYAVRKSLLISNILLLILWFNIGYAPRHWLDRVDFGNVQVDDKPVPSAVYMGNPKRTEAEAIALVRVPGVGSYLINFDSESIREASEHDFAILGAGAWTWNPMDEGQFSPPLPFLHVNECRIKRSDGRVIKIVF